MSDDDVKYIREGVDKVKENLLAVNIQLARYNTTLEEHTRRTTNLENRVEPIETHVRNVSFLFKLIAGCAPLLAAARALHLI